MLHPDSPAAKLRSVGLEGTFHEDRVRVNVIYCLNVLRAIAKRLPESARSSLRASLYESLPSLSIYRVDEIALVSVFLHGRLAVDSPQIEVHGSESLVGKTIFGEFEKLWALSQENEFSDLRFGARKSPSTQDSGTRRDSADLR